MSQIDTPVSASAIAAAAGRLQKAATLQQPCPPVRDLIGRDDLEAAYAVQQPLAEARLANGAEVVGRKIGLTSQAVQTQLGVDQPDFGVLFDDMVAPTARPVPIAPSCSPGSRPRSRSCSRPTSPTAP